MTGIAVINYMAYQKTIECINSIRETTHIPYKIYLLENGSENESASKLLNEYLTADDVELIISKENCGYARGNNICIQHMRKDNCDYGVISNNDIICQEGTIQKLVSDLETYKELLLVGPMIVDPKGSYQKSVKINPYNSADYIRKSTYISNFYKKEIEKEYFDTQQLNTYTEVSWVSGAFFAFSLTKMEIIGDFDPATFLFFEEYILSQKAKKKGMKLGYEPEAKVIHYHAYSTGGNSNIIAKIAADRSERYYFSHYTNVKNSFLIKLKIIRLLEVLFTFGKRRDFKSIFSYLLEINKSL